MNTLRIFKKDFYDRFGGLEQFKSKTVLDLGCGDGEDSFEISKYAKKVIGIDIVKNPNWGKRKKRNLQFKISEAEKLPFANDSFTGLFLKDVIHHVQDIEKTMKEIKRVTMDNAVIILIEGNRYNPLFYVHMTKINHHEHLSQNEFKKLVLRYFPKARFTHFESHFIPYINAKVFGLLIRLEKIMDKTPLLKPVLSYNAAIINSKS